MFFPPPRLFFIGSLIAFGGNFQYGYQITVINSAEDVFKAFLNASWFERFDRPIGSDEFAWFWSLAVNVFYVGAFLGVLFVSMCSERFGRKNAILISNVPGIIGTLVVCVWPQSGVFELFVIGRFIIGFHAGLSSGLQPLYLTEISLPEYRGAIGSLQLFFLLLTNSFGMVVGLPGLFGNKEHFMFMLALPLLPHMIHSIAMLFFHETPEYLLLTAGDRAMAEKSLQFFNGKNANVEFFVEEIRENENLSGEQQVVQASTKMPSSVWIATIIGAIAGAAQSFTASNAFANFSSSMYIAAGVSMSSAQLIAVIEQVASVIWLPVALAVIDRVSRRVLLIGTILGCAISNCLFVLVAELSPLDSSALLFSFIIVLHSTFYSFGVGQIPWFLTSEMVPQAYRSFAQTISTSVLWATTIVAGTALYPLYQSSFGSFALLVLFIAPSFLCAAFLFAFMPESRGKLVADVVEDLETRWRTLCGCCSCKKDGNENSEMTSEYGSVK